MQRLAEKQGSSQGRGAVGGGRWAGGVVLGEGMAIPFNGIAINFAQLRAQSHLITMERHPKKLAEGKEKRSEIAEQNDTHYLQFIYIFYIIIYEEIYDHFMENSSQNTW